MFDRRNFLGFITLSAAALAVRLRTQIPERTTAQTFVVRRKAGVELTVFDSDNQVIAQGGPDRVWADVAQFSLPVIETGVISHYVVWHPEYGELARGRVGDGFEVNTKHACVGDSIQLDVRLVA